MIDTNLLMSMATEAATQVQNQSHSGYAEVWAAGITAAASLASTCIGWYARHHGQTVGAALRKTSVVGAVAFCGVCLSGCVGYSARVTGTGTNAVTRVRALSFGDFSQSIARMHVGSESNQTHVSMTGYAAQGNTTNAVQVLQLALPAALRMVAP